MHASSIILAATALFLGAAQASPVQVAERQDTVYGWYVLPTTHFSAVQSPSVTPPATNSSCVCSRFFGDGIVDQALTVGHGLKVKDGHGKMRHLDCGTTSNQFVPGIFAKCSVDGEQAYMSEIKGDKA